LALVIVEAAAPVLFLNHQAAVPGFQETAACKI
jgi:hypothetical protein